ncbi:MAG: cytochrome b N-terminal domain-containing protein [Candidatus Palauibacterales bacterium]|nr:cytochrome b N-terminal domain-containing protein [Candidatus Palauibacterales bacterium]MDP2482434.1 cytochrome b N-terminal domain-containing protein [Candidatus Palauibacterales bacterium]
MLKRARAWLVQVGDDLKESTDASLLSALRFLGLLYGPIDRRLPIDEAYRKARARRLPPYVGWRHSFGGISYLLFMVLVVTGVLLAFYYRPSVDEAYASLQYITTEVPFGWLLRDLHLWAANLIVLAIMAHMARVFFTGAYRPPRETSWFVGVLLLFVVLAFGGTGYLLPWDQWAYWTSTEVMDVIRRTPVVGGPLSGMLTGDLFVSGATLSRYFALHAIILPWAAFGLLVLHFVVVRKHGTAPPKGYVDDGRAGVPFYPNQLLRIVLVSALVLAVTISLAALFPRPMGDPATPFEVPDRLVSSWIVVDVSLGLLRTLGVWGFVGFSALGLLLIILPLVDRDDAKPLRRKPLVLGVGLLFFLGFVAFWAVGRQLDSVPPSTQVERRIIEERAIPNLEAPDRDAVPEPEAGQVP